MKKISYIKHLIFREWLPIIVIFLCLTLIPNCWSASTEVYYYTYESGLFGNGMFSYSLIMWMIMAAVVMPIVVFSYRFSTRKSDLYFQLPLKSGELKNIRLLTGLICLAGVMVISFIIPFFITLVRYSASPDSYTIASSGGYYYTTTYYKTEANLGMMFVAFLVALAMISLEYFISCFFFSLCHKPASGLLMSISLHLFIGFFFFSILLMLGCRLNMAPGYNGDLPSELLPASSASIEFGPGIASSLQIPAIVFVKGVFKNYEHSYTSLYNANTLVWVFFDIQLAIHIILGVGSLVILLLKKEKSGELCNNYGFANKKFNYLFFLPIIPLVIGFAASSTTLSINFYVFYLLMAVVYYFLFALFSGTFKIQKGGYIFIGVMLFLFFTLPPFLDAVTGVSGTYY